MCIDQDPFAALQQVPPLCALGPITRSLFRCLHILCVSWCVQTVQHIDSVSQRDCRLPAPRTVILHNPPPGSTAIAFPLIRTRVFLSILDGLSGLMVTSISVGDWTSSQPRVGRKIWDRASSCFLEPQIFTDMKTIKYVGTVMPAMVPAR
jgi:hypothetical protein